MLLPHQDDKKKLASIIVGSISKSKDKSASADESSDLNVEEDDSSVGGEAVAEDILRAIQSRDAKGLFDLLKHLVSMVDDDSGAVEEAE